MADEKKSKAGKSPAKSEKAAKGSKGSKRAPDGAALERGAVASERPTGPKEKPRLARHYMENVRPALMQKFGYRNVMQAPHLVKIVLNMGVGDAIQDAKLLD